VKSAEKTDLRAYTVVYESLIPDHEGEYAQTVADFLGIPIRFLKSDELGLFERWDDPEIRWPEPVDDPIFAGLFDQTRMVAADCRVVLEGEGMDNLMHFEMWPYVRYLLRNHEWRRSLNESVHYLRARPSIWPGVRRRARALFRKRTDASEFPQWIEPGLAKRLNLEERWREKTGALRATPSHPFVPVAHASLTLPQWSQTLELQDPGVTRCPIEVRHPFLDLRIVDFVLAIPPFPWSFQKRLLREAMAGHLPEAVRLRPKTPLEAEPVVEKLRRSEDLNANHACWTEQIDRFVNRSKLPVLKGKDDSEATRLNIRPLCLNFWLQSMQRVRYNNYAEARNG
jgi:asparagine synthase (glutamine-hydrolysing)